MPESKPAGPERTLLTGWGGTAPSAAVVRELDPSQVSALLAGTAGRGVIARGLGRSYGDAAQNAGGTVIAPLPERIDIDPETGLATVSAGTSLHTLIEAALPLGWFVPVTPGTRYVTVGGAIACDVHGKNHHRQGTFGAHVRQIELVLPDGSTSLLGPEDDVFWATVGGMGLTGVIVSATVQLLAVETGWMSVRTERLDDIEATMTRMQELDASHTYTVCWIDTLATGDRLGRSVLSAAEHATVAELSPRAAKHPRAVPGGGAARVPPLGPLRLVSRPAVRLFNEAWFRRAPRYRVGEIQSIAAFFHPLDGVRHWNRLYGRRGFVQYQFVIPDQAGAALPGILERVAALGHPSFLSVLKRFGPQNRGLLSFPRAGWTLAMDLPVAAGLPELFAELDRRVLDAGGRLYLAKDSRLNAETVRAMYPRWEEFLAVRERIDPNRVLRSDLSRRLGL